MSAMASSPAAKPTSPEAPRPFDRSRRQWSSTGIRNDSVLPEPVPVVISVGWPLFKSDDSSGMAEKPIALFISAQLK